MVTFIHAADLHLDTPFSGLKELSPHWKARLQAAPYQALDKIVETAISKQVDFVIFAGDIYDQAVRGFKAQMAFLNALKQLECANIPIFVIFGNHDYAKNTLTDVQFPENVHIFNSGKVTTAFYQTSCGEKVALSGFSYAARHEVREMIEEFPLRSDEVDYHIGIYHGQIGHAGDAYAPFQVTAMQQKHYNYWALGHIHQRQFLATNPPIVYSGTTQGRHALEVGEKGIYHVTLSHDSAPQLEFLPTQSLQFENITLTIEEESPSISAITEAIKKFMHSQKEDTLYRMLLKFKHLKHSDSIPIMRSRAWREHLNETLLKNNQCIVDLQLKIEKNETLLGRLMAHYPNELAKTEYKVIDDDIFLNLASDLTDKYHIPHRDFLDISYRRELLEKARTKLSE
ncbi:metallophosphoesterase family protein [Allofustis seminis]|uniref:metallophosphoesterase family protein n=1 Tax=Allofustis seminis TaxID=166939 RepID=UPI000378C99C|nr:DNA repair exonuclease [Allofustis seminis]